jgi:hypothetical protein
MRIIALIAGLLLAPVIERPLTVCFRAATARERFSPRLASASAEIIDRVAVSIENTVITESELLRQIRLTAFLNDAKPDFSSEKKRETADRLIEQTVVRREIATTRYATDVDKVSGQLYGNLRERYKTDDEYRRALAAYGISDEDVREAFRWQSTLLEFIDARFRPGIQIPEAEIREHYENEVRPKATANQPLKYEDVREDIERILVEQRVDNALDRWLGQARTQIRIRFKEEVFK